MPSQRTIRWPKAALKLGVVLTPLLAGVLVAPLVALERTKDPDEELDDFTGRSFDLPGPAMASLLVSRSIGVAPQAHLHSFALDFARLTPQRLAEAIDLVVARDDALPAVERARLVSISTGYRGADREIVDAALERALAAGVFVLNTVYPVEHVTLYAPSSRRTVAGPRHERGHTFDVEGGDSQWAPYLTGVLALALQVAPEREAHELASLLAAGASEQPHGVRLVDPVRVLALAQER